MADTVTELTGKTISVKTGNTVQSTVVFQKPDDVPVVAVAADDALPLGAYTKVFNSTKKPVIE